MSLNYASNPDLLALNCGFSSQAGTNLMNMSVRMEQTMVELAEELAVATEELCPGCERHVTLILGDDGLELLAECDCAGYALT